MKKVIAILVSSILLIAVSAAIYLNSLTQDEFIYPSVSIEGIDISGYSIEEAKTILEERLNLGKIAFKFEDKSWDYSLKDLGFSYDYDKSIKEAYDIGREDSLINNWITIFKLNHSNSVDLKSYRTNNYQELDTIYNQIKAEIDRPAIDATLSISDSISITPDQVGAEVDIEKLKLLAKNMIEENHKEINIEVPVNITQASIKKAQLSEINGVIGEFTTSFNAKVAGRSANIKLASSKVDALLLMPGQELSFNNATGKISLSTGYKNAPVIVKGELQEGVGGGVCQVSTTLYNSVLYAGLEVLQRRSHSIPSGYVSIGRDAAVSYGSLDFVFKNSHDYPVYITEWVSGNTVTAKIYGNTTKHKNKTLSSEVVERIPRQVKYINDPTLPLGKEVIDDPGRDGIKSVTYETVDGVTKVVSRDHYPVRTKIVKVGTGPAEVPVNSNTLNPNDLNVQDINDQVTDLIFGGR